MIEKEFNPDVLYSKIVHYYMDKKGYGKTKANTIAQYVVKKETERRICKRHGCGHFMHDHIRNTGVCLAPKCTCDRFTKMIDTYDTDGKTVLHTVQDKESEAIVS